jgi:AcrR family transcriptional regulator
MSTGSNATTTEQARRPVRAPILRGLHARDRVLRAALDVLADDGMAGFSIEAVAHRAGASKATIYRRWASPGQLLVDAMDTTFTPLPLPATGHLRGDLIQLIETAEGLLDGKPFPRLLAAFIDAAERESSLQTLHAELTERRREPLRAVLLRASMRGEIPATADIELAIDLLASPLFYRRFVAHSGFPNDYAVAVVDHVLTAIGHGRDRDGPSA